MAMYEIANIARRVSRQDSDRELWLKLASMDDVEQQQVLRRTLNVGSSVGEDSALQHVVSVYVASYSAMRRYRPRHYSGATTLFRAQEGFPLESNHPMRRLRIRFADRSMGWARRCPALHVAELEGDHFTMVLDAHADALAEAISGVLKRTTRIGISLEQLPMTRLSGAKERAIEVSPKGVRFDPFHPTMIDDPHPVFRQLREHAPVYQDATSTWWLTRYADISEALRDKRLSVDARHIEDRDYQLLEIGSDGIKPCLTGVWFRQQKELPLARIYNNFMVVLDPPAHHRLRRFFAPLFDPASMSRLKSGIERRVNDLIAEMCLRRDPDVIRDLALPLPVGVISEMMGTPQRDGYLLESWAKDVFLGSNPMLSRDIARRIDTSAQEFERYMGEHIERRRASLPRDDLLGLLLKTSEGQDLSTDELVTNCMLLFVAGVENTSNMIGNASLALLRDPAQALSLREQLELTEGQVDEFLRYEGAVRMIYRVALEDLEIGGKRVQRGEYVALSLSAANRDPEVFTDPDRLDLTRNAKHHLSFSHGIHYCLGAPLLRMELASAIPALFRHDFSLVPGGMQWKPSVISRSLERLRIAFH
jgi:cytochrome P450